MITSSIIYTGVTELFCTPSMVHNWVVTIDALEDGQLCTYCGTPVFFNGEGITDCPKCGAEWVNAEFDPADELNGPAVDELEFDNDPDMIENDEFEDAEELE